MRIPRLIFSALIPALVALGASACSRSPARTNATAGSPRVVCLTPSSTEIVAALGAVGDIVGVDSYSHVPPEVDALPRVGDFMTPDLEAILALRPTLVLADAVQTKVQATLARAHVPVLAIPLQTVEDVRAAFTTIGGAIGRADAARAVVTQLDQELAAVGRLADQAVQHAGRRPRVLFVVDRQVGGLGKMVAAGPGTYLDELLHRAGADNVLSDALARYVNVSAEEVIQRAPDIVFDAVHTDDGRQALADWQVLSSVPAVRDARIYLLQDAAVVSPGPRLALVLRLLYEQIWTERR